MRFIIIVVEEETVLSLISIVVVNQNVVHPLVFIIALVSNVVDNALFGSVALGRTSSCCQHLDHGAEAERSNVNHGGALQSNVVSFVIYAVVHRCNSPVEFYLGSILENEIRASKRRRGSRRLSTSRVVHLISQIKVHTSNIECKLVLILDCV
jgi:hypothetical protein